MIGAISAAVICHGALIREAIIDTLESDQIEVAWSGDALDAIDGKQVSTKVGIYVLAGGDEFHERREAQRLLKFDVSNWIILCDNKHNAICRALLAEDRPLCTAPIDVTRRDLVQLVRLAARNRRLCVDSMCDRCPAAVVDPLSELTLSNEHLQLLRYLSEGLSNKQIARLENCSESLIKVRMRRLLDRLHLRNRTQAAVLAARSGLNQNLCQPIQKPHLPSLLKSSQPMRNSKTA